MCVGLLMRELLALCLPCGTLHDSGWVGLSHECVVIAEPSEDNNLWIKIEAASDWFNDYLYGCHCVLCAAMSQPVWRDSRACICCHFVLVS